VFADPAGIVRLASQVDSLADQLLAERARLESAAVGVEWKSTAASTFARRAEDSSHLLRRDADKLEELADALRGHARRVEARLEFLADLERRARELAAQGVDAVEDAASGAAHAVDEVANGAADAAGKAKRWVGDHAPW
jgi:hypothetical protein